MAIIKLYRREAGGALRYRHYAPKGPRARSFMVLTGKVGSATGARPSALHGSLPPTGGAMHLH